MAFESSIGGLRVVKSTTERGVLLTLSGRIDESARLDEVAAAVDESVIIDLEGVEFINSMGARNWVNMMRAFADRAVAVTLRRCSEVIVFQMNMILEARMGAKVESVLAPYECEDCGDERFALLEVSTDLVREQPTRECEECGGTAVFAEMPASYFLFLEDDAPRA